MDRSRYYLLESVAGQQHDSRLQEALFERGCHVILLKRSPSEAEGQAKEDSRNVILVCLNGAITDKEVWVELTYKCPALGQIVSYRTTEKEGVGPDNIPLIRRLTHVYYPSAATDDKGFRQFYRALARKIEEAATLVAGADS